MITDLLILIAALLKASVRASSRPERSPWRPSPPPRPTPPAYYNSDEYFQTWKPTPSMASTHPPKTDSGWDWVEFDEGNTWSLFSNDDDEEYSIGWSSSWSPWDSSWLHWSTPGESSSDSWISGVDPWGSESDSWDYYGDSVMYDSWNFMGGSPSSDSDWGMLSLWSPWDLYELINIDNYWTHHEELNWCKDDWDPEMTTDEYIIEMMDEFVTSGSITNWCIGPGQVLILSDLRNRDLNDPYGLPEIFRTGYSPIICTEKVCQALLNQRDQLIPAKLTSMALKIMETYKAMGCVDCFCESAEKEEMESVLSITKDYLKKQVILGYNVTMETPREVSVYYQEMKEMAGLLDIPIDPNRNYIPLMTMDEAIKGPGSASQAIQAITELTHGIGLFCS